MRKFDNPFDSYELAPDRQGSKDAVIRPMSVELHSQGIKRYLHLINNPIYYFYAFQFIGGWFYRALWGYEKLWDTEHESKLMQNLSEYLTMLKREKLYRIENYVFRIDVNVDGAEWKRGVKPELHFNVRSFRKTFRARKGSRVVVRIDRTEPTNRHADIEFYNGKVYTVHINQWNLLVNSKCVVKPKDYEKPTTGTSTPTKPTSTNAKDAERREAKGTKSSSRENPSQKVVSILSYLRQRLRRAN